MTSPYHSVHMQGDAECQIEEWYNDSRLEFLNKDDDESGSKYVSVEECQEEHNDGEDNANILNSTTIK